MKKKMIYDKKNSHRRLSRILTISAAAVAVLTAVILLVGTVMFFRYYNMLNVKERNAELFSEFTAFPVAFDDNNDVTIETRLVKNEETTLDESKQEKEIINFLLIGADYQTRYGNADAIIIASINSTDCRITLTSIMRDTRVAFPGVENGKTVIWNDKISNAHAYGGPELLICAIENNFGIKIHNYAEVHYEEFVKVFDDMNGLDIVMSEEEVAAFNNESAKKVPSDSANKAVRLDGEQVLSFVRIRYLSGSDFMRTDRHRRVLTSTFNKVKSMSVYQLDGLLEVALPLIETDMSASDCFGYVVNSQIYAQYHIENFRIPMNGTFSVSEDDTDLIMSREQIEKTMEIWAQKITAEDE